MDLINRMLGDAAGMSPVRLSPGDEMSIVSPMRGYTLNLHNLASLEQHTDQDPNCEKPESRSNKLWAIAKNDVDQAMALQLQKVMKIHDEFKAEVPIALDRAFETGNALVQEVVSRATNMSMTHLVRRIKGEDEHDDEQHLASAPRAPKPKGGSDPGHVLHDAMLELREAVFDMKKLLVYADSEIHGVEAAAEYMLTANAMSVDFARRMGRVRGATASIPKLLASAVHVAPVELPSTGLPANMDAPAGTIATAVSVLQGGEDIVFVAKRIQEWGRQLGDALSELKEATRVKERTFGQSRIQWAACMIQSNIRGWLQKHRFRKRQTALKAVMCGRNATLSQEEWYEVQHDMLGDYVMKEYLKYWQAFGFHYKGYLLFSEMILLFSTMIKCRLPATQVKKMDSARLNHPEKEYTFLQDNSEFNESIILGTAEEWWEMVITSKQMHLMPFHEFTEALVLWIKNWCTWKTQTYVAEFMRVMLPKVKRRLEEEDFVQNNLGKPNARRGEYASLANERRLATAATRMHEFTAEQFAMNLMRIGVQKQTAKVSKDYRRVAKALLTDAFVDEIPTVTYPEHVKYVPRVVPQRQREHLRRRFDELAPVIKWERPRSARPVLQRDRSLDPKRFFVGPHPPKIKVRPRSAGVKSRIDCHLSLPKQPRKRRHKRTGPYFEVFTPRSVSIADSFGMLLPTEWMVTATQEGWGVSLDDGDEFGSETTELYGDEIWTPRAFGSPRSVRSSSPTRTRPTRYSVDQPAVEFDSLGFAIHPMSHSRPASAQGRPSSAGKPPSRGAPRPASARPHATSTAQLSERPSSARHSLRIVPPQDVHEEEEAEFRERGWPKSTPALFVQPREHIPSARGSVPSWEVKLAPRCNPRREKSLLIPTRPHSARGRPGSSLAAEPIPASARSERPSTLFSVDAQDDAKEPASCRGFEGRAPLMLFTRHQSSPSSSRPESASSGRLKSDQQWPLSTRPSSPSYSPTRTPRQGADLRTPSPPFTDRGSPYSPSPSPTRGPLIASRSAVSLLRPPSGRRSRPRSAAPGSVRVRPHSAHPNSHRGQQVAQDEDAQPEYKASSTKTRSRKEEGGDMTESCDSLAGWETNTPPRPDMDNQDMDCMGKELPRDAALQHQDAPEVPLAQVEPALARSVSFCFDQPEGCVASGLTSRPLASLEACNLELSPSPLPLRHEAAASIDPPRPLSPVHINLDTTDQSMSGSPFAPEDERAHPAALQCDSATDAPAIGKEKSGLLEFYFDPSLEGQLDIETCESPTFHNHDALTHTASRLLNQERSAGGQEVRRSLGEEAQRATEAARLETEEHIRITKEASFELQKQLSQLSVAAEESEELDELNELMDEAGARTSQADCPPDAPFEDSYSRSELDLIYEDSAEDVHSDSEPLAHWPERDFGAQVLCRPSSAKSRAKSAPYCRGPAQGLHPWEETYANENCEEDLDKQDLATSQSMLQPFSASFEIVAGPTQVSTTKNGSPGAPKGIAVPSRIPDLRTRTTTLSPLALERAAASHSARRAEQRRRARADTDPRPSAGVRYDPIMQWCPHLNPDPNLNRGTSKDDTASATGRSAPSGSAVRMPVASASAGLRMNATFASTVTISSPAKLAQAHPLTLASPSLSSMMIRFDCTPDDFEDPGPVSEASQAEPLTTEALTADVHDAHSLISKSSTRLDNIPEEADASLPSEQGRPQNEESYAAGFLERAAVGGDMHEPSSQLPEKCLAARISTIQQTGRHRALATASYSSNAPGTPTSMRMQPQSVWEAGVARRLGTTSISGIRPRSPSAVQQGRLLEDAVGIGDGWGEPDSPASSPASSKNRQSDRPGSPHSIIIMKNKPSLSVELHAPPEVESCAGGTKRGQATPAAATPSIPNVECNMQPVFRLDPLGQDPDSNESRMQMSAASPHCRVVIVPPGRPVSAKRADSAPAPTGRNGRASTARPRGRAPGLKDLDVSSSLSTKVPWLHNEQVSGAYFRPVSASIRRRPESAQPSSPKPWMHRPASARPQSHTRRPSSARPAEGSVAEWLVQNAQASRDSSPACRASPTYFEATALDYDYGEWESPNTPSEIGRRAAPESGRVIRNTKTQLFKNQSQEHISLPTAHAHSHTRSEISHIKKEAQMSGAEDDAESSNSEEDVNNDVGQSGSASEKPGGFVSRLHSLTSQAHTRDEMLVADAVQDAEIEEHGGKYAQFDQYVQQINQRAGVFVEWPSREGASARGASFGVSVPTSLGGVQVDTFSKELEPSTSVVQRRVSSRTPSRSSSRSRPASTPNQHFTPKRGTNSPAQASLAVEPPPPPMPPWLRNILSNTEGLEHRVGEYESMIGNPRSTSTHPAMESSVNGGIPVGMSPVQGARRAGGMGTTDRSASAPPSALPPRDDAVTKKPTRQSNGRKPSSSPKPTLTSILPFMGGRVPNAGLRSAKSSRSNVSARSVTGKRSKLPSAENWEHAVYGKLRR